MGEWKLEERMTPQEFIKKWKIERFGSGIWPKPLPISRIIKDELILQAKSADQPWTKDEILYVMHELGLRPGYD